MQQFLSQREVVPSVESSDGDRYGCSCQAPETDRERADYVADYLELTGGRGILGQLGDYDILEIIGGGGMGIVLRGRERPLNNRAVAIKILARDLAESEEAVKRFMLEAIHAASVEHEHVVPIYRVNGGRKPYFVMRFLPGQTLQERIEQQGPLNSREVLRIGLQAAQGLAAAHAAELVHRDVKPGNVLLEEGTDRVILTDFGIAFALDDPTLTGSGFTPGTPHYMSPEQTRGDRIDHRSDLFSLGSVLYAMCTGRPPFQSETTLGVLQSIREDEPLAVREISPAIPDELASLISGLLEKSPKHRFQSAGEVAALLEEMLNGGEVVSLSQLPGSSKARAQKRLHRFAFLAPPAGGKTCLLAALAMPIVADPKQYTCTWIPVLPGQPRPEGPSDAWSRDSDATEFYRGADRLEEAIERLERRELPHPTAIEDEILRYRFQFSDADKNHYNVELIDYSGELVTPAMTNNERAARLRARLADMDGLLVLAEVPHSRTDPNVFSTWLLELQRAFVTFRIGASDAALENKPICLLVNKWDRRCTPQEFNADSERCNVDSFLDGDPEPPHRALRDVLRNATEDANFRAFAVSAFGEHEIMEVVVDNEKKVQDFPKQVKPHLRSFGLLDPFIWASRRTHAIKSEEGEPHGQISGAD